MKSLSSRRTSKRKYVIAALVMIVLLTGGFFSTAYLTQSWPFLPSDVSNNDTKNEDSTINYDPPTQEDINNGESIKEDIINKDSNNQATPSRVEVAVSYADVIDGNVEVRAFIPGVIESDGTCSALLQQSGQQSVTESSLAFIDSSTSQCRPIYIPVSEFPTKGKWQLTVSYKSKLHSGISEVIEVMVK